MLLSLTARSRHAVFLRTRIGDSARFRGQRIAEVRTPMATIRAGRQASLDWGGRRLGAARNAKMKRGVLGAARAARPGADPSDGPIAPRYPPPRLATRSLGHFDLLAARPQGRRAMMYRAKAVSASLHEIPASAT